MRNSSDERDRLAKQLTTAVRQALTQAGVVGEPVLVAVSGGPDSTALLRVLLEILGSGAIHAAHFNHQLRGAESDGDEAFVRDLCQQWNVALTVERRNIGQLLQTRGGNLEALARRERYAWLAELANHLRIRWVATGHTANDQAETVLFRLLRGSGLRGLRGIAPQRRLADEVQLVRPLLRVTRQAVNAYLQLHGIQARTDSSNFDLSRLRNRIRWQLLPLLEREYNASVVVHLATLAEHVHEHYAWLEQQAWQLLQRIELPRFGEQVVLDAHQLRQAEPFLLRQALRLLWEREDWPTGNMTTRHWQRLCSFLRGESVSSQSPHPERTGRLQLPAGVLVERHLHTWRLFRRSST
jgi:tRNA(Ile)-lysidine synthase